MTPSRAAARRSMITRAVLGASGVLVGLGLGLLVAVNGCDEQSTPPSNQGGGLSQNPKSLLGRSAKTAKDVGQKIENNQAEAGAMADEISGQGTGLELAGLSWPVSTSWEKAQPASSFIAAEFHVQGDGGQARLTISTFDGGAGGSIDQNVERWQMQFKDDSGGSVVAYPKKITVAGCPVTMVTLDGVMKGGMPGGPSTDTPNWALRGALIEGPQGLVVVKLAGPKETVDAASQAWEQMIDGMKKKSH